MPMSPPNFSPKWSRAECQVLTVDCFSGAFPLIPAQNLRLGPCPVFGLEAVLAATLHVKFISALPDLLFYPRMRLCRRGVGGMNPRVGLWATRLDGDGTGLGRGLRRLPGALGLPGGAISCGFFGHGVLLFQ